MPKAEVEGKVIGDVGRARGVGSKGEVSAETNAEAVLAETKAGAVVQIWSLYIDNLQDPGMSMLMGSGVWSRGPLMESGVSGSRRRTSSSIVKGVCCSVSESMVA